MAVRKVGQDKGKERKITCKHCGAKLAFYPKDVKTQSLYSMGEYDGSYDYIVCPQCNQHVTVPSKDK